MVHMYLALSSILTEVGMQAMLLPIMLPNLLAALVLSLVYTRLPNLLAALVLSLVYTMLPPAVAACTRHGFSMKIGKGTSKY